MLRTIILFGAVVANWSAAVGASFAVTLNSDVIAGRTAFVGSGTTQTEFDWDLVPVGAYASRTVGANMVVGVNSHPSDLSIKNWVDAPGFDGHDLAISGPESFDLEFGSDHKSVGFAIITGTGLFPSEIDLTGATFEFKAFDAADSHIGTVSMSLDSGAPDQAWVTLTAMTAFRRIEVRETGVASSADQYFSDIITSVEAVNAVPEPSSLALLGIGAIGLIGGCHRRRRKLAA